MTECIYYRQNKHMRSVEQEQDFDSTIRVKIVKMGADTLIVKLPEDATVAEAFEEAGMAYPTSSVLVAGVEATRDAILDDGDVINVIGKKDGGLK